MKKVTVSFTDQTSVTYENVSKVVCYERNFEIQLEDGSMRYVPYNNVFMVEEYPVKEGA